MESYDLYLQFMDLLPPNSQVNRIRNLYLSSSVVIVTHPMLTIC
jgi:hypothetical protein